MLMTSYIKTTYDHISWTCQNEEHDPHFTMYESQYIYSINGTSSGTTEGISLQDWQKYYQHKIYLYIQVATIDKYIQVEMHRYVGYIVYKVIFLAFAFHGNILILYSWL